MKKNEKGFTLVELLAVIVVLSVLILIAVTAVIPRMNKAKRKTFANEALQLIKAAEERSVADDDGDGTCYYISSDTTANPPIQGLVGTVNEEGAYVKKSDGTTYVGVVKKVEGNWTIYIRQTNKDKFIINGKTASQIQSTAITSLVTTGSSNPSGFVATCS